MSEDRNDPELESLIPDPDVQGQQQQPSANGGGAASLLPAALALGVYLAQCAVSFAVEHVGKWVAVEPEIAKDRVRAEGGDHNNNNAAAPAQARGLFSLMAAHYKAGGVSSFLRGAKLSLAFLACTSVLDVLLSQPLRHVEVLGLQASKVLLIPLYWALATLPLRTVRNLLTTNYICGVADVPFPQAAMAEDAAPPTPEEEARRRGRRYYYDSVGDVWRRLRTELSLSELLTVGWELHLFNRYLSIGVSFGLQRLLDAARGQLGPKSVWLPAALATLFAATTALHHPFTVLTLRLSLLVPPSPAAATREKEAEGEEEEEEKKKEQQPKRGLRYRNGWDCLCTIVREEGVGALFAGWYFPVARQHFASLLLGYLVVWQNFSQAQER